MKDHSLSSAHCAIRLRSVVSHLSRQLHSSAREGTSVAKLSALGQLYRLGPLTPTALASRERVKLQSLTRLIAELESDGCLVRMPHATDRRQSLLALTRKGVGLLTADVRRREASLAKAIDRVLDADDRALLMRACTLLDGLAEAIADEAEGSASRKIVREPSPADAAVRS